jgi:hypothetical protein
VYERLISGLNASIPRTSDDYRSFPHRSRSRAGELVPCEDGPFQDSSTVGTSVTLTRGARPDCGLRCSRIRVCRAGDRADGQRTEQSTNSSSRDDNGTYNNCGGHHNTDEYPSGNHDHAGQLLPSGLPPSSRNRGGLWGVLHADWSLGPEKSQVGLPG